LQVDFFEGLPTWKMEAGTRVNSLSRIHELYRGLSSTGKLGVLLVLLALSSRFGGKLVFKNGKIISHLPYCKWVTWSTVSLE